MAATLSRAFPCSGNSQSALETPSKGRGSDRWLLHHDEASTTQMREDPLGDDRRHDVGRLCLRQAAIMCKCER
jgi:hypothetical protein